MKKVIVFFDVEADLVSQKGENKEYLKEILDILKEKEVSATLNVCGRVVETFPDVFKKFSEAHELSSHTYNHENIIELDAAGLNATLEKTENAIKKVSGKKPLGFRSPWLYTKPELYTILEKRGYRWVSNKRVRRKEILANPSFQFSNSIGNSVSKALMSGYMQMQWQLFPRKPFTEHGLVHIPLLSSMDGELLGQLDPNQKSSKQQVDYVISSLKKQYLEADEYFNLTFHDWIVGSGNRTEILSKMLDFLKGQKCEILTAAQLVQ
jgi:peptidoglycan/xylan/chitin deacetylase (PgdA/CDA1 family)